MVPTAIGTGDLGGASVPLVTTAETVVVSSGQVPMPNEVTLVVVIASFAVTPGTGATGIQARLRRGNQASSPQIGQTYTLPATAAVPNNGQIMAVDQQTNGYTQQYTLTVQQVAATGNGSVTSATVLVLTF